MKKLLLSLLALFYVFTIAFAVVGCQVHAAEAPPRAVAEHTSLPGESMDAFALRIAPSAQELSYSLSSEVCGEFRRVDAGYSITLYSTDRLKQCSYVKSGDATGVSFHTHVFIGVGNFHREGELLRNPRFSNEDYDHPGYLSSGRLVLHQNGEGTDRRVRM